MNQGFTSGPQANLVNKDGAVFIAHADGTWTAYYTAFNSSSLPTNPSTGEPLDGALPFFTAVEATAANHTPQ